MMNDRGDRYAIAFFLLVLRPLKFAEPLDPARPSAPKCLGDIDRFDPVFLLEPRPTFNRLNVMMVVAHWDGRRILNFEAHAFCANIIDMTGFHPTATIFVVNDAGSAAEPLQEALGDSPCCPGRVLFAGLGVDAGHADFRLNCFFGTQPSSDALCLHAFPTRMLLTIL